MKRELRTEATNIVEATINPHKENPVTQPKVVKAKIVKPKKEKPEVFGFNIGELLYFLNENKDEIIKAKVIHSGSSQTPYRGVYVKLRDVKTKKLLTTYINPSSVDNVNYANRLHTTKESANNSLKTHLKHLIQDKKKKIVEKNLELKKLEKRLARALK